MGAPGNRGPFSFRRLMQGVPGVARNSFPLAVLRHFSLLFDTHSLYGRSMGSVGARA